MNEKEVESQIARIEESIKAIVTARNDLAWQLNELNIVKDWLVRQLPPEKQLDRLFH